LTDRHRSLHYTGMRRIIAGAAACVLLAVCGKAVASADQDLLREVLRQQSAAQREGCSAIKRTLATGQSAALVVRTAVEIGYNACQVIRCAVEGGADPAKVIQGAGEAGVKADVVARCAVEAGVDSAAVARVFSELVFEPNFCYFTFSPGAPYAPQPPVQSAADRGYQRPQASTFTF
jgi:hypothetical protein